MWTLYLHTDGSLAASPVIISLFIHSQSAFLSKIDHGMDGENLLFPFCQDRDTDRADGQKSAPHSAETWHKCHHVGSTNAVADTQKARGQSREHYGAEMAIRSVYRTKDPVARRQTNVRQRCSLLFFYSVSTPSKRAAHILTRSPGCSLWPFSATLVTAVAALGKNADTRQKSHPPAGRHLM